MKSIFAINHIKPSFSRLIVLLTMSLLLTTCVDEISFDVPERELEKLVIIGQVSQGSPSTAMVRVSRSNDFKSRELPSPVGGAQVRIEDAKGSTLDLPETAPGVYQINIEENSPIEVVPGNAFRLFVTTPDGNVYRSTQEVLNRTPKADSLSFSLVTREVADEFDNFVIKTFIQFAITTPLFVPEAETAALLKWDFDACFQLVETPPLGPGTFKTCYVKEKLGLGDVILFNGAISGESQLNEYMLLETELNHRFADGFYLTTYQKALSQGAFQYWDEIRQSTDRQGGLFEAPPGPIISNLMNENDPNEQVLGYFFTEMVDTVRLLINFRGQPDIRPKGQCERPIAEGFDYCSDCLLRERSSLEKPDYWVE